jgi:hypothetical protein
MKLDPAGWLPLLRARKRAVLLAVLPALALASAAATACAAAVTEPTPAHSSDDSHGAHHGAEHGEHSPSPTKSCPHCPLESGSANAGHAACAIDEAQEAGGAAPAKSVVEHHPPLTHEWRLPAARASPPLIAARFDITPLPSSRPLTVRYCSLLI